MTQASASLHMGELGMAELTRVCAQAGQLVRPVRPDLGIDAFIEVAEGSAPTGDIIGVQVKSGDSFLSADFATVVLPSDADHFAYWARCAYPIIGVVHIPRLGKNYWVNLSRECTEKAIRAGPYRVKTPASKEAEFTPASLQAKVIPEMLSLAHQRLTLAQTNSLLRERARVDMQTDPELAEKLDSWQYLLELLVGISSSDADVADAGYRVSWYYPAVSADHRSMLASALGAAPDSSVAKMLRAIHHLSEHNADYAGEAVMDLLKYVPAYADRIQHLLKERLLPTEVANTALQVLEYLDD